MARTAHFADELGPVGHEDDLVVVPTCDDDGFAQLATVRVTEVVVQERTPFASEFSVCVRLNFPADQESRIYEPDEVIVITAITVAWKTRESTHDT